MVLDVEQERVPAAREQAEERRLDGVGLEEERCDVAVQMVDRDERQTARPGERLRSREPDKQRADQARPPSDCDTTDVVEAHSALRERLPDDGHDELEMPPRGDLRDDASVARVQVGLRGDDVREDAPVLGDERGRRLVARRLEPEDQALAGSRTGSFHMISASSRLSV